MTTSTFPLYDPKVLSKSSEVISPTIIFVFLWFAVYAAAIDLSYSFATSTLNPRISNPSDKPPTPANKSITVGFI